MINSIYFFKQSYKFNGQGSGCREGNVPAMEADGEKTIHVAQQWNCAALNIESIQSVLRFHGFHNQTTIFQVVFQPRSEDWHFCMKRRTKIKPSHKNIGHFYLLSLVNWMTAKQNRSKQIYV